MKEFFKEYLLKSFPFIIVFIVGIILGIFIQTVIAARKIKKSLDKLRNEKGGNNEFANLEKISENLSNLRGDISEKEMEEMIKKFNPISKPAKKEKK